MKSLFKKIVVAILTFEAKMLLKRTKPNIIAITGSVGKTSVKDAIYAVMKDTVHTRKSEKSFNSDIGVPLSVLGLPNAWSNPFKWMKNIVDGMLIALHPGKYPKLLVLEMGVDRPGDMAQLTEWIKPDVVVLTRLPDVPVHVEFFKTPEAVIAEKKQLVEALKPDGVLVYNHDDEKVVAVADEIKQQSIGYSRTSLSPYTASADKIVYENGRAVGFEFMLTHMETAQLFRVNGSLGAQHAYNYAAAVAVGSVFNVSIEDARDALAHYVPPQGRMRLLQGKKETLIVDDTYNASPVAMEKALSTLKDMKGAKRRIAVLGDMMELGQFSVREHERMGELVVLAADILITIGVRAQGMALAAEEEGMPEEHIIRTKNAQEAADRLEAILEQGDIVLVKGSQSIRAERVVERIMEFPEQAKDLLVRQSEMWKRR
ncbi:MAG: UDP-N-acetylmuramoyl-tripeptide--D-alanyl-D-alanine ligase [Candidatus Pacebacteria bacterium]|nr:UDP-N-acetylmuramoyl-tripeptide--D-alanyl-D-alanine ligase [Candidatus Paceibacterota bacterium]